MSKERNLCSDWKILKFSECIQQLNTGLNPRNHFSLGKGKIKYITAKNLTKSGTIDFSKCDLIDEKAKSIINKRSDIKIGDILFSSRAPIGHCHLIKDEPDYFDIGESIFSIRVNQEIVLPEYLCLYLSSNYFIKLASQNTTGSIIQEIRISDLMNTSIIIPPKYTQKHIAESLNTIDNKIDLNNKINAELESMAKTLYDYWFLQFEFPNEEGKPYKSSGGKMFWNEELKREIPEDWEVGTLSQIANITMGSSPKGESLNDEKQGIIFYQGKTDFGFRFPVTRMYTISPVKCANIGDILLSVRAPVGSMNIANEKCCIGRGLAAISGKCKSFLYYMMLANQFQFDKYNNGGTTFGAITKDDLFGLKIIVPNNKIIQRFNDKICHMDKLIEKNEKENQELADLRDFLLPLLMNGQVGFKE